MSPLANLKLVAAKRPVQLSPVVMRRNKVANRIAEQIATVPYTQLVVYKRQHQCKLVLC